MKFPRARVKKAIRYLTKRLAHLRHRIAVHQDLHTARLKRLRHGIKGLIKLGKPYVLGGGHGHNPIPYGISLDCSGFCSWALQVLDIFDGSGDTSFFAGWGKAGPGKRVTLHILHGRGGPEDHMILELHDKDDPTDWRQSDFFEAGGRDNTNHGSVCKMVMTSSRLSEFKIQRHPEGW